ncbi:hypothetical protein P3T97_14000 (plasmid) [Mammaliicoccus sciuri]|uniref:hypothetical protein n=1 Tax=Mammaliicoccus sciuri TaxID=1296 RepID=UPI002B262C61|nr:hypothetical protein [Mammaliicoccus sciuri]WQJ67278.1 hypothetical protein P3T97_14000 [Mammaliicoccus sciuri]
MKRQKLEHVKVQRHYGRFYEIGERFFYEGKRYIILEHETFGNDVEWVVIEENSNSAVNIAVEDEDILEIAYAIV